MDPHAAIWEQCLEPASLSDVGLRRSNNQDSLAIMLASSQEKWEQRGHLFVVADGMGAHAAGELASKLATDAVPLTYAKLMDRPPAEALLAAVEDANAQIHTRGMASDDFRGMGTTVSVLVLSPQGALVAHVGDSRIYRLRGTRIEQLTFDHSLVWELRAAKEVPQDHVSNFIPKNIITRSLGPNARVQVDMEGPLPILAGDTFLLCSDGLSGQINDDELGQVLLTLPPKEAVRALVDLANLRGGPDNITVIVVRVLGPQEAKEAPSGTPAARYEPQRPPVHPAVWSTMGILVLIAPLLLIVGQKIAALGALVGALVAAGVAAVQRFGGRAAPGLGERPLGRAPYVVCDASPTAVFSASLAVMAQQLRDAAAGAGWKILWDGFCRHESQAAAAVRDAKHHEAVREYCRAISVMMEQLRHQTPSPSANGGNLPRLL
jgi:PPM family protein phosphatase